MYIGNEKADKLAKQRAEWDVPSEMLERFVKKYSTL